MTVERPYEDVLGGVQGALPLELPDDRQVRKANAAHRVIWESVKPIQDSLGLEGRRWSERSSPLNCVADQARELGRRLPPHVPTRALRHEIARLDYGREGQEMHNTFGDIGLKCGQHGFPVLVPARHWDNVTEHRRIDEANAHAPLPR